MAEAFNERPKIQENWDQLLWRTNKKTKSHKGQTKIPNEKTTGNTKKLCDLKNPSDWMGFRCAKNSQKDKN